MKEIFDDHNYGFTDSVLCEIKLDYDNIRDYLIVIDHYIGKDESCMLTLRLKNVKIFNSNFSKREETDLISILTLAHISKTKKDELVEFIVESAMTFFPEHENDEPLIHCLCEEVYIEK